MKVTITHLKAPWPAGARIGDVVDVGASLPGCFAGKCKPVADDAEASHEYDPPAPSAPATPVAMEDALGAATQKLRSMHSALIELEVELEKERATSSDLRAQLAEARDALLTVASELDAARGELADRGRQVQDLRAKLAEAEAALLASKQAQPAPKGGKG